MPYTIEQWRACGDYSGSRRDLPSRDDQEAALRDEASMTQADRTWLEFRVVTIGDWHTRLDVRA